MLTRAAHGTLRLRIDDLDAPRAKEAYLSDVFETLHWLGIGWDEGPRSVQEQQEQYTQQRRLPAYEALLQRLVATGRVFACTCSRKDIREQGSDGQYPGTCLHKRLPLDTPDAAWRIDTPPGTIVRFTDLLGGEQEITLDSVARHFIVRRRDGIPAYHVASLADDLDYRINLIVRGADLCDSTAAQLFLAGLLDEPAFAAARFCHHPLVRNEGGEKLSKSAGSVSLKAWQAAGKTREDFYAWFGKAMGWGEALGSQTALAEKLLQHIAIL